MSLLLFALGGLTAFAGIALSAAGLNLHDATVDAGVLTPGAIMTVGGFILVGVGAVVRELRQFRHVVAGRSPQTLAPPVEPASSELLRFLAPEASLPNPTPPAGRTTIEPAPAAPAVTQSGERRRIKFPTLVRSETPPNGHPSAAAMVGGEAGLDNRAGFGILDGALSGISA